MGLLKKLWGIGKKAEKELYDRGVETIESVAAMDVPVVSAAIGVGADYLIVASSIARNVSSDFVETIGPKTLTISRKIYGVGTDIGLLLYSLGVKDITDVTEDTQLTFPAMQEYFERKFEKIKSQVQLSLIPGLTSRNGHELVNGGFSSLADLAGSTAARITSICRGVSTEQANSWISMASKLASAGIRNYKKAGELPLAKKIRGIGPEFAATLYGLGINSINDFIGRISSDIRDTYFDWVEDSSLTDWINQALSQHALTLGITGTSTGYYPYGMNSSEFWTAVFNPSDAMDAKECSDEAFAKTAENYPTMSAHNDVADAFRHAYWNCCLTRKVDAEEAKKFADAHEDFEDNPANEKAMDLFNNQVGRNLGSDPESVLGAGNWGDMSCEDLVKEAIRQNKLQTSP
jgi:predicted flap endonuclease-1-like 5' DNA nuclease